MKIILNRLPYTIHHKHKEELLSTQERRIEEAKSLRIYIKQKCVFPLTKKDVLEKQSSGLKRNVEIFKSFSFLGRY